MLYVFFFFSFSPLPRYQKQLVSGSGGKSKLRYQKNPCGDSAEVIGCANMNIIWQLLLLASTTCVTYSICSLCCASSGGDFYPGVAPTHARRHVARTI